MDDCLTLRDAVQRLINQKIISVDAQEATPAHTPAPALVHPSVADSSSSEPTGFEDVGTSGVFSLTPVFSESSFAPVDPSGLIGAISFSYLS